MLTLHCCITAASDGKLVFDEDPIKNNFFQFLNFMGSKYLKIADGLSSLFPKKVSVHLVHAVHGTKLGTHKFDNELIPETFTKPTILEVGEKQWQITKSVCDREESYLRSKILTLHVQEPESFTLGNRSMVPSMDGIIPNQVDHSFFDQFTLSVAADDWRQLEFLPISQLTIIQEDLKIIDFILARSKDPLQGFDGLHTRNSIPKNILTIPFGEFCDTIQVIEKGNVSFEANPFVQDGFALRSGNYTYYGILKDNIITDLCIEQFETVDEEFSLLISKFELVFIDWCNAKMLLHEIPDNVHFEKVATKDADYAGDGAIL